MDRGVRGRGGEGKRKRRGACEDISSKSSNSKSRIGSNAGTQLGLVCHAHTRYACAPALPCLPFLLMRCCMAKGELIRELGRQHELTVQEIATPADGSSVAVVCDAWSSFLSRDVPVLKSGPRLYIFTNVTCVCACVRVRARACVCVCVCVSVCVSVCVLSYWKAVQALEFHLCDICLCVLNRSCG